MKKGTHIIYRTKINQDNIMRAFSIGGCGFGPIGVSKLLNDAGEAWGRKQKLKDSHLLARSYSTPDKWSATPDRRYRTRC
jgi:hypothetical protein